jgi:hypothetical protein
MFNNVKMVATVTFSKINAVSKIEIPQEARDAVVINPNKPKQYDGISL